MKPDIGLVMQLNCLLTNIAGFSYVSSTSSGSSSGGGDSSTNSCFQALCIKTSGNLLQYSSS